MSVEIALTYLTDRKALLEGQNIKILTTLEEMENIETKPINVSYLNFTLKTVKDDLEFVNSLLKLFSEV